MKIRYLRTSTLIIEWDGRRILTDPWFASRMRGLPVFVRPYADIAELGVFDLVLVSHLHPDHYDEAAMRRMDGPCGTLIGPPALARRLPHRACVVRFMNDGDILEAEGFTLHAFSVPHSGYENAYVVEKDGLSLLFAADARYDPVFALIGERHRPCIALLPVGGTIALGRRIVMNPADAFRAALDLGARVVMPIHRGGEWMSVPPLSFHPGRAEDLVRLAREAGHPFDVVAPALGEAVTFDGDGRVVAEGGAS